MAKMYHLAPYISEEELLKIKPQQILYALPNVHRLSNTSTASKSDESRNENLDVKALEKAQLDLIERLKKIGSLCEPLLQNRSKAGVGQEAATQEKAAKEVNKKESKEAKKEARKENKAKALEASKEGHKKDDKPTISKKEQGEEKKKEKADNSSIWIVKEEKPGTECSQSLTANVTHGLSHYEKTDFGPITLTMTPDDQPWVEILAKIGEKRNVLFVGAVRNNAKDPKTTIAVSGKSEVTLSGSNGNGEINGRIAVWKAMGALLGLYSFSATMAIHSAHSHQWLIKADSVLSNAYFKDSLMRECSQFLSSRDSLGGHFSVSIADLVVYSLIANISNPINNVELWATRIRSALN